jgi:hypothetical protein
VNGIAWDEPNVRKYELVECPVIVSDEPTDSLLLMPAVSCFVPPSVYLTGQNTRMSPKWYSNEAKLPIILKI